MENKLELELELELDLYLFLKCFKCFCIYLVGDVTANTINDQHYI